VNSHETIPDNIGLEVSDLETMQGYALQAIHEIRQDANPIGED
jgi:hypothetical protein